MPKTSKGGQGRTRADRKNSQIRPKKCLESRREDRADRADKFIVYKNIKSFSSFRFILSR